MSRIGKQTIKIPTGVTVSTKDGVLTVQGSGGTLSRAIPSCVHVAVVDAIATVTVDLPEDKAQRSLWGTFSAHIQNMVDGVTTGFKKELEVNGVGYRVSMQGTDLKLEVGFSHPVIFKMPQSVRASVEKNLITLVSPDKELLGQTAAELRSIRKPEPYKGKGIKYVEEVIRRKAGKAAKSSD